MKIYEYKRISKKDFFKKFGFSKFHYYNIAYNSFKEVIDSMKEKRPNVKICLHHLEPWTESYELWNPVIPMYEDEHIILHSRPKTDDEKEKISAGLKGYKQSDEHIFKRISKMYDENGIWKGAWNRGKTGLQEGYFKGKTGENYPLKGTLFWTDGIITKRCKDCPGPNFKRGMKKRTLPGEPGEVKNVCGEASTSAKQKSPRPSKGQSNAA